MIAPVSRESIDVRSAPGPRGEKTLIVQLNQLLEGDMLEIRRRRGRTIRIHGKDKTGLEQYVAFDVPDDVRVLRDNAKKRGVPGTGTPDTP